MKRKLSLLLAVVMILGSFSFAFAADEVVPAEFLEKEGILVGNDSGDLMLDQPLLRKDAVVLLARLMKAEKEAEAFEKEGLPTFNDLADNPYYKGFLAWAEDNGYFTGKTDGSFGYTDNLEAVEYALVLLRALGYVNDNKADEWDNAWTEAEKLGLLEDVKAERRDEIKREEVAQMTYNALGVTMKDSDKTLAEFLGITMPEADELEVVEVRAENLKEIIVELSNAKLADEEKLENTNNYRLSGNEIERVEVKDNNVLVQVKNTFRNGKEYELQIKGVDKAVDGKYKFVAEDNTIPAVEKVEALGEYGIKVITTEPISNTRSNNFLIDGKNVTMDVEQYGRTIILTPYRGSFDDDAKTLTIKELKDFAGFRSVEEDFDIEIVKDAEAPEVVDAVLKGDTVEVVFDKDIYIDSVGGYYNRSDVGNFSYELGRHTIYADDAKKVDVDTVVYTFKANEVPSRRDEVTIEGVTNHSKEKMEKTTIGLREVLDDVEPEIIDTKITRYTDSRKAKVKLYFDKDVTGSFINKDKEEEGFVVKDHFVLYENEVGARYLPAADGGKIVSAKYDVDEDQDDKLIKDVIVVELEDLEIYDRKTNDLEYILEIEGFTNTTSSRYKMFRDYYEFKFTKTTDFVVSSVKVDEVRGETEITITFNKYLDRKEAEDAINYTFYEVKEDGRKVFGDDVADLDGEAELIGNGTKVLLTIPEEFEDLDVDYDGLRISDAIKDTGGNRLSTIFYYDFASKEVLKEGQTAEDKQNEKAAKEVVDLINELPEDITLADKEAVAKAKEAYDKLEEAERKFVDDEVKAKLDAAVAEIERLEKEASDKDEAEKVKAINEAQTLTELWDALNVADIENLDITLLSKYDEELTGDEETLEAIQAAIDKVNLEAEKEANQAAVNAAKTEVENATFDPVENADVNTAEDAKTHVEGIIETLELGVGVTATVIEVSFDEAEAGTSDGSYVFTVELSKGADDTLATATTDQITLIINQ